MKNMRQLLENKPLSFLVPGKNNIVLCDFMTLKYEAIIFNNMHFILQMTVINSFRKAEIVMIFTAIYFPPQHNTSYTQRLGNSQ